MAQLIPTIKPSEIENTGERMFAEALIEQLPSRVQVFHSMNWLSKNNEGLVREGESDFVILDPDRGLLFVEVKGGNICCVSDEFEWYRQLENGKRETIKSPFSQARKSMYALIGKIKKHGVFRNGIPFTYTYAAAFPGCRYSGSLPPDIMAESIFDAEKCSKLNLSIRELFDQVGGPDHERLNPIQITAIREVLYPDFGVTPVLWRQVQDQEAKLRRMTEEQSRTLNFLKNQKKALIQGVAGSGKTILALAKAQEMARKGAETLFLCYNKQLKEWLDITAEKVEDRLTFSTYHGLVADFAKKANVSFRQRKDESDEDFWNVRAPETLMDACGYLSDDEKYDAVIVDEGQDFQDLWWASVNEVFKNPHAKQCYYIFYDPLQNIYVAEPTLPDDMGEPYPLEHNCRNTVCIARHCESIVQTPIPVLENAPLGIDPEIISVGTIEEAFRAVEKKVRELCFQNQGKLNLSQVAVLADGTTKTKWPRRIAEYDTTEYLPTWMSGRAILMDSWARFKGLEADAIIIVDSVGPEDEENRAARYVSRSRAKHLLIVIEVKA